jgi:hypothetical protein
VRLDLVSFFDDNPKTLGLAMGTLDDDPGIRLAFHVFVGSKAPWFEIADESPQFDRLPPATLAQPVAGSEWVVYAKPPFGGPRQVLKYLARYSHRVAISNQRLISLENGRVTFRWKNYARASEPATMTLQAAEFIRRFLLPVWPSGFVKVRHFGFLANRGRRHSVGLCRKLLAARSTQPEGFDPRHDSLSMEQDAGPLDRCPRCKVGSMGPLEILLPQACAVARPCATLPGVPQMDTS